VTTTSPLSQESTGNKIRVAILGTGLIGGSAGLALCSAEGWHICGWDCDPAAGAEAINRGALHELHPTAQDAVQNADIVVIAVPVMHTESLLESITGDIHESTVVTDVGSTKGRIVEVAEKLLGSRFVGGHPMAGSEKSGISAASAVLFSSAPWFVTPTPATERFAVDAVCNLAIACGAVPRLCPPDRHDQLAGVLSHLPHLLAYGLAQAALDQVTPEWRDVAGGSFQDGTRVAASSPELWTQILMDNRVQTLAALARHEQWIATARAALEDGDTQLLKSLLDSSQRAQSKFPNKRPYNPV
jgi:prephenate dehydrogenase